MGIINIVKNVKKVHPEYVVMVKVGKFYYTYGKDAYIISYLFDYKLTKFEEVYRCGFIEDSLNKVMAKLEHSKINYIILDRKNNYDVDEKAEFRNLNKYSKFFEEAKKIISLKIRIINITDFLNNNIQNKKIKEILREMEKAINENREI